MNSINNKFLDKELYKKIYDKISKIYKYPSAYKSMALVKEYKKRGGKILDDKKTDGASSSKRGSLVATPGTARWLDEKWINMDAYLDGAIVKCGAKGYEDKSACRPLVKVSKLTPMTASEVVGKYGKNAVQKAIDKKNADPQNLILQWEDGLKVIKKNKK